MIDILSDFVGCFSNIYFAGAFALFVFITSKEKDSSGLLYLLFFTVIYNSVLKEIIQLPLPETCNSTGFGFPSGHTNFYSIIYMWAFLKYKNKYARLLIVIVLFISGWHIVHKGYHYPRDVLLTPIFAALAIYLYRNFISNFSDVKKIITFFLVNSALLVVLYVLRGSVFNNIIPAYFMFIGFVAANLAIINNTAKKLYLIILLSIAGLFSTLLIEMAFNIKTPVKWLFVAAFIPLVKITIFKKYWQLKII